MRLFDYGRHYRLHALRQLVVATLLRSTADRHGETEITGWLDEALPTIRRGYTLRQQAVVLRRKHAGSDRAVVLDREVGRLITGLWRLLLAWEKVGDTRAMRACRARLYPQGLGAHVQSPFLVQCAMTETLVAAARTADELMGIAGIADMLDQIEVVNHKLSAVLRAPAPPTGAQIAEAESQGEEALLWVVHRVLALFNPDEPAEVARRDALLQPLLDVYGRIQADYRQRAKVAKVPKQGRRLTGGRGVWVR